MGQRDTKIKYPNSKGFCFSSGSEFGAFGPYLIFVVVSKNNCRLMNYAVVVTC
ncbi:hypothetical protein LguiA_022082 [Lonicera macranthoides]